MQILGKFIKFSVMHNYVCVCFATKLQHIDVQAPDTEFIQSGSERWVLF